ncbi:hypothetical protein J7643_06545 [bacterium]|nr:hypothetical protein [bacterium]
MERDYNRPEANAPSASDVDLDIRRNMLMARNVTTAHPEMVENMTVTRLEKVEPFGADLVHWGSIWGGFFAYLACATILSAFAIAARAINPAQSAATIGFTVGLIMLVSTFVGAVLAGWTSNLRSRYPGAVNGIIYASVVLTLPLLFGLFAGTLAASATTGAVAGAQAAQGGIYMPGSVGLDPRTLSALGGNVGWFSVGSIVILALGAVGYLVGMRSHMNDLGLIPHAKRAK